MHKALLPVTSRWREIGLGLRLKSRLLTDVGKAYFGDPSTCLSMTISYWLEGEYNTERFGKPTWKKVVEVVGDPAAGNDPSLACQIAREHLGKLKCNSISLLLIRTCIYTCPQCTHNYSL